MSAFDLPASADHDDDHHDHDHDHAVDRRSFLRAGGAALIGAMAGNLGMPGIALSATPTGRQKTFIMVFQRGGADALHLFPAAGDADYQALRPNIKVKDKSLGGADAALDFAGKWQLNPLLASLKKIPNLTLSASTHFEDGNRSHFDCQRWIERGSPLDGSGRDGIFNRYLQIQKPAGPVQGIAAGSTALPLSFLGPAGVPAINTIESFKLENRDFCTGKGCPDSALEDTLRKIVSNASDDKTALAMSRRAQQVMLDAITAARAAAANPAAKITGTFSNKSQGRGLKLIAQLLKANLPVSIATIDWENGWDSHQSLPSGANAVDMTQGYNANVAAGADDLLAFYNELGPDRMKDVVVLVGSEFGRTMQENGTRGADHGKGGAWFAFGGSVPTGNRVLAASDYAIKDAIAARTASDSNYYIPFKVNYKDLIGEIMVKHLGLQQGQLASIFPNYSFKDQKLLA